MSDISFLEAAAKKRQEHLTSHQMVPDDQPEKHIAIKNHIKGFDEAVALFRADRKTDNTEGDKDK